MKFSMLRAPFSSEFDPSEEGEHATNRLHGELRDGFHLLEIAIRPERGLVLTSSLEKGVQRCGGTMMGRLKRARQN
jgi:hypothetical protein